MFERQRFAAVAERTALARKVDQLTRWTNDMVILADEELGIADVTDRTAEALGYSRAELLQMTLRDLIDPAALAEVDASGAPFAQRLLWASALRNEASPARGTGLWETRCRRKDGSTFPVEASVHAEEMGGRRYHHAIVRDVTDRLAAQEALRASEARFRAAFDGVSLGMVLLDPEGRILECNRAFREMLGLGDADLRGRLGREFLHPDDAASAFEDYGALKSGTRATVEASRRHVRADATLADTLVRLNPLRDGQGNFQYALAMVEDVSEKRRLEAQLRLADRMASVGTLAAGVAHEINNPLAFVLANLEYAIRELRHRGIGEEVVGALEEAREGGTRVREIVRDLKTFSRADDQAREVLDVPRVLRSTLTLASNEIRARARLDLQLGPTPPVLASEHRLGQVFLNLLINAAQAIPEGRPAGHAVRVVSGAARDGRALVEVSDDGVGIPAEIRGRIFDPFFTTKPVGVGTGLGLSICHGIVTALGGEIQVESEPGRGSTFRVLLPAAPADAAARAGVPTQLALGRRARVLVVDDEPLVCRAVQRILSPPHDVDTRSSARDALEVLRGPNGYDLILCDLMMPEMTGMDLHEQIHAASPGMAERFVFLTGGAYTANARDFLARVPNPRVEKPFDPMALRDLVARVLGGSSAPLG
jgi:PAS domain S-box-containing protein